MVYTDNRFEWDPEKAESNAVKHGVRFEEAMLACDAPCALITGDILHSSEAETRNRLIGSLGPIVLTVIFTIRSSTGRIRLISARLANRKERRHYEKEKNKTQSFD